MPVAAAAVVPVVAAAVAVAVAAVDWSSIEPTFDTLGAIVARDRKSFSSQPFWWCPGKLKIQLLIIKSKF